MARTGWPGLRQRSGVGQRRPIKRLQEFFDRAITREAVALIEAVGGVETNSPPALRKNIKPEIAIDADRLFVLWPRADVIDQKPGQDVVDRIGMSFEPDLPGNRGASAIGPDHDPRREAVAGTGMAELNTRRKPGSDLNTIDAAQHGGAGSDRGLIEGVADAGMPQI